ncbi:hypothetical protein ABW19_dt0204401 [Dactylella cylindrospora]|nr:hypothetical protein ABW19_dt0204401 [Dactylella cylindrospora]
MPSCKIGKRENVLLEIVLDIFTVFILRETVKRSPRECDSFLKPLIPVRIGIKAMCFYCYFIGPTLSIYRKKEETEADRRFPVSQCLGRRVTIKPHRSTLCEILKEIEEDSDSCVT